MIHAQQIFVWWMIGQTLARKDKKGWNADPQNDRYLGIKDKYFRYSNVFKLSGLHKYKQTFFLLRIRAIWLASNHFIFCHTEIALWFWNFNLVAQKWNWIVSWTQQESNLENPWTLLKLSCKLIKCNVYLNWKNLLY